MTFDGAVAGDWTGYFLTDGYHAGTRRKAGTATNSAFWDWMAVPGLGCRLMLAGSHPARRLFGSRVRRIAALAVETGWRKAMKQRNRADEGVGSGGVSMKLVEKAQLPGFGFSGQGDTALQGRRQRPNEKCELCIKDNKLEISSSMYNGRCKMNIGQDGVTEILADIPSVCGRSRGRMTGETIIQFCAAGLAAA